MNANELAEIADGLSCEIPVREWIDNEPKNVMNDIATMLRQQQAEIKRLGSELNRIVELYTDKALENEALKKELALQKLSDIGQAIEREFLYTHPVKDLEDIDINITWNENSMRDFGKDELNFARALLKKASDK